MSVQVLFRRVGLAVGLTGAVFLAVAPWASVKSLTYFFLLLKFLALAQAFNLVAGYVGYISFGHIVFFGIGSYIAAILTKQVGLSFYPAFVAAGVGTAALASVIGYPLLKLRGAYFAIATLALNEAVRVLVFNIPETYGGGAFGLPVPQIRNPLAAYYAMFVLAAVVTLVVYWLIARTRHGIALKAIREDEDAARVMGIHAPLQKTLAFGLSALFMGFIGAADLQFSSYVFPEQAFRIETNVEIIVMTMLGGAGTVGGPLLGAAAFYVLDDYLWGLLPFSHLILLGVLLAGMVLYMRRGLLGLLEDRFPVVRGTFV